MGWIEVDVDIAVSVCCPAASYFPISVLTKTSRPQ